MLLEAVVIFTKIVCTPVCSKECSPTVFCFLTYFTPVADSMCVVLSRYECVHVCKGECTLGICASTCLSFYLFYFIFYHVCQPELSIE